MTEENAEHWERALAKFESVQAIKASPSVRFHIALCEEKLGRLAAALSDYEAARVAARAENSKEVLATVEEPIARLSAEVPHVTLTGEPAPAGTTIEIDGRNLSTVGFGVPIPLDPGAHKITVTAPGRPPFTHSVVLTTKADVGVRVVFESGSAPPPPQADLPPPKAPVKRHPERPYAIATTIGAVAFVGAGVGMILGAGSVRSSNEGTCLDADGCGPRTTVRALDWGGASGLLVGAGLAAASIVLWTRPARTSTTSVGFGPGRLTVGGTFQ